MHKIKRTKAFRFQWIKHLHIDLFHFFSYTLFIVLLLILWRSLHNLTEEMRLIRMSYQTQSNMSITPVQESADTTAFSLQNKPDAMVLRNTFTISGEAAHNTILSLKVNGELAAAVLPKKNKFTFENVRLEYGSNNITIEGIDQAGNIKILEKITTFFGSPRLNYLARDFTRGNRIKPQIALTFDGGAGNGVAAKILDDLAEKNVHCTMFLTGNFIKHFPDLARRIVAEGHEVGNHTWSHPHLTTIEINSRQNTLPQISRDKLQEELTKTAELFFKTTHQRMAPYWRAPYGEHNLQIRRWAAEIGYTQVGWTIGHGETMDTMDWVADTTSKIYKPSHAILQKLLDFGKDNEHGANGSIILMHLDTQRDHDQVYTIIPALIDSMRARGYEFVKVSQLRR
ncbi:MAG: polysaccharide deacetylase family protein [Calditrichaeota bacterium]|nr:polysaccharide deacetylase family protein [Calditrichota bacterium]